MSMRSLVAAGVLVLTLSGCVASTPSPTPTASETSTPTPTPTAEAFPSPTVPLSCDDFLTDEAASDLTQQPVVAREPAILLNDLSNALLAQVGVLTCAWAPVGSTDFRSTLAFTVLSSADSEYAAAREFDVPESQPCQVDVGISVCRGDTFAHGYWLQASAYSRDTVPERTIDVATTRWTDFLAAAQTTLASAGPPLDSWVAPESAFSLAYCDGRETTEYPPRGALSSWALERADLRSCSTAWDGYVTLGPASAWAVSEMADALPAAGVEMGQWQAVDVAGADLALVASGEVCTSIVSVGVDALQFSTANFTVVDGVGTCDGFFANISTYLAEVTAAG